jgi:hypothetical protein
VIWLLLLRGEGIWSYLDALTTSEYITSPLFFASNFKTVQVKPSIGRITVITRKEGQMPLWFEYTDSFGVSLWQAKH